MSKTPTHFKGKEVLEHVVEAQAQGILSSAEIHGTEMPGHLSAAADAAKETAIIFLILWTMLLSLQLPFSKIFLLLLLFTAGWFIWKSGRSAWLGWSRLERVHRIVAEERWEIEHHRQQERDELRVLYAAKGFEGKLLEDVLDVLMADNDRALQVMVEEELGLSLEAYEHPLKQSVGAGLGVLFTALISCCFLWLFPSLGVIAASLGVMAAAAAFGAKYEKNRVLSAIVWNLGLGIFASGSTYFLLRLFTF